MRSAKRTEFTEAELAFFRRRLDATTIPEPMTGCWLCWDNITSRNYARLVMDRVTYFAHRIAFLLDNGRLDPKLKVLHRCDTPACVNPLHLWQGTQLANMQDMTRKGRHWITKRKAAGEWPREIAF